MPDLVHSNLKRKTPNFSIWFFVFLCRIHTISWIFLVWWVIRLNSLWTFLKGFLKTFGSHIVLGKRSFWINYCWSEKVFWPCYNRILFQLFYSCSFGVRLFACSTALLSFQTDLYQVGAWFVRPRFRAYDIAQESAHASSFALTPSIAVKYQ